MISQVHPILGDLQLCRQPICHAVTKAMAQGITLPVVAYSSDDKEKLGAGALLTIDNAVDEASGTIKAESDLPQHRRHSVARPVGQRAPLAHHHARYRSPSQPRPCSADPMACSAVYVVQPDSTVAMKPIDTGATFGDIVMVSGSVAEGDLVVTNGHSRLQPGVHVTVHNDVRRRHRYRRRQDRAEKIRLRSSPARRPPHRRQCPQRRHERFGLLRSPPGRHRAVHGGDPGRGRGGACRFPARGRRSDGGFPDHPGDHNALPGASPGSDGRHRRAAPWSASSSQIPAVTEMTFPPAISAPPPSPCSSTSTAMADGAAQDIQSAISTRRRPVAAYNHGGLLRSTEKINPADLRRSWAGAYQSDVLPITHRRRLRREHDRAADRPASRRRQYPDPRRPAEARHPHPDRSHQAPGPPA